MLSRFLFFPLLALLFMAGCQSPQTADLIVYNAQVYTVDSAYTTATAFAVKDGRFIAVGSDKEILAAYNSGQKTDASRKPVYPGFIDAHCHFYGYGLSLQAVNLVGAKSFSEVIQRAKDHQQKYPNQSWITGRGWDQNTWQNKQFPTLDSLDAAFPDVPVLLRRIDGHAAIANTKALQLAGINQNTKAEGGLIDVKKGRLTGLLIDNAVDLVLAKIPAPARNQQIQALLEAEKNCFAVGLTTLADAGLDSDVVELIDSLQQAGKLQMRVYAMLNPSEKNLNKYLPKGPLQTDKLTVRSVKVYADGALGSRGACLLHDYADLPGHKGFLLTSEKDLQTLAQRIAGSGFQMNTHCIGDSANRLLLNLYASVLQPGNNRRWRIEHAQVVHPADVPKFGRYSIIPSVQPTHATSDMYWLHNRLGEARAENAYAYKTLWNQNGMAAFGSDFPVEDINPLYGFHAAVARQDSKNYPPQGYQTSNAVSREQALRATTIYAAFANFEDDRKGSIEVGKLADFVVLDKDLLKAKNEELRGIKVLQTWLGGQRVF